MELVFLTINLLLNFQILKEIAKKCDTRPQASSLIIRNNLKIATLLPCPQSVWGFCFWTFSDRLLISHGMIPSQQPWELGKNY